MLKFKIIFFTPSLPSTVTFELLQQLLRYFLPTSIKISPPSESNIEINLIGAQPNDPWVVMQSIEKELNVKGFLLPRYQITSIEIENENEVDTITSWSEDRVEHS